MTFRVWFSSRVGFVIAQFHLKIDCDASLRLCLMSLKTLITGAGRITWRYGVGVAACVISDLYLSFFARVQSSHVVSRLRAAACMGGHSCYLHWGGAR